LTETKKEFQTFQLQNILNIKIV